MRVHAAIPPLLATAALLVALAVLLVWRGWPLEEERTPERAAIAAAERQIVIEVGRPLPDFTLGAPDGAEVRLSDFRGQTVVLNFWAEWCEPCLTELPIFESFWQAEGGQGDLIILAVNWRDDPQRVRQFLKQTKLTFTVALDPDGEVYERYGLPGLPVTLFVDAEGVLRSQVLGPLELEQLQAGVALAGGT